MMYLLLQYRWQYNTSLARDPSKVLNGQHKWVINLICHWSRNSPWLVKLFKVLHYYYLLLRRATAAWDMQWRNRKKRNDQERHVKASFFTFCCLLCYLFLKKCLLHFLLLVMLFAHVAKRSNSRSQRFFKTGALKISRYCIHRKTPVLEPLFNEVSGLKACIFI